MAMFPSRLFVAEPQILPAASPSRMLAT